MPLKVFDKIKDIRQYVVAASQKGCSVGLVPTMGALHDGHLSLIRTACHENDLVIVSIFVNPTQFGPAEDYEQYPRPRAKDQMLCQQAKVAAVFWPTVDEMYGSAAEKAIQVTADELAGRLCGPFRPGHFNGVLTIVLKLFLAVPANQSYFGAKDWQQLVLIKKMVDALKVPMQVKSCPIIRDSDGLALSSRNAYLNVTERQAAQRLYRALKEAQKLYASGLKNSAEVIKQLTAILRAPAPVAIDIQYAAIVNRHNLCPVTELDEQSMVALAVIIGGVRLIDNWRVGTEL